MRRSNSQDRITATESAKTLMRMGRDIPTFRSVLAANRIDGLRAAAYDGVVATGGEVSDPTMRMAIAFADPQNGAHDEADMDAQHFNRLLDEADRTIKGMYRLYAKWLPQFAHIDACANPYGCPDGRPATKGRKGLCLACYSHQHKHDGAARRDSRVKAVAA